MNRTVFSGTFRGIAWASMLACTGAILSAQPALTTIQDILFRADGTRFNGIVTIEWKPFVAGSSTFIPQQGLKLDVVNGVLRARLVPTTNASAGANYEVTFASQGKYLFAETWAVPPSLNTLKVRDVRVSSGTVIGNPPVFGQVSQISDVDGLDNELMLRPIRGFGFALGRAAMINAAGQIDGVQGNLSDCVRADGTASPCATGSGDGLGNTIGFADGEVPTGTINGSNATFTLLATPAPAASLLLYRNGLLMHSGVDFLLSGQTITFLTQSLPQAGDLLLATYRTFVAGGGTSGGGGGSSNSPQIICSGTGGATSAVTSTSLASCVLEAAQLQEGDRIEVQFSYQHYGTQVAPRFTIRWGASDILTRAVSATESGILGTVNFTISSGSAIYMADSRGVVTAQTVGTGTSAESITGPLTVSFRGLFASASAESLFLRSYSVVRYPAVIQ